MCIRDSRDRAEDRGPHHVIANTQGDRHDPVDGVQDNREPRRADAGRPQRRRREEQDQSRDDDARQVPAEPVGQRHSVEDVLRLSLIHI